MHILSYGSLQKTVQTLSPLKLSYFYWKKQDVVQTYCSCSESPHIFAWYRTMNTEMVCFGKWDALGNGIIAWTYPGVNQVGKNSLTAVMFKWNLPLHIPSYSHSCICTVKDNWTQRWKLRYIVRNIILGTAHVCTEGWDGTCASVGWLRGLQPHLD